MQKFKVNAADFGIFASIYYVGYAGAQIPIAILLDRFNPKWVISLCAFFCGLGNMILVYCDQWTIALLCRVIIGVSSVVGFLGTAKMVSLWYLPEKYSKMLALNCTFGLMGAVFGGKPMSQLISTYGWEKVIFFQGLGGLFLSILFLIYIKTPSSYRSLKMESTLTDLKRILTNNQIIIIAIATLLMVGALEGFADVWGVSYLMQARNITKEEASLFTSTIFFGMIFGAPILSYISNKSNTYYTTSFAGLLIGAIFFFILLLNKEINDLLLYILLFLVGILCSYQVLIFSIGMNLVPLALCGITVAFLNCINMLGGSFFHTVIGFSLELFSKTHSSSSFEAYDLSSYTYALSTIPLAAILGGLLMIMAVRREDRFVLQSEPSAGK